MAYEDPMVVQAWLDALNTLNVKVKKMFGCYCLYCDGCAVGWIHDNVLNLREVGLDYLPHDVKRPGKDDSIREITVPFDYVGADWLPAAVRDTALRRKKDK